MLMLIKKIISLLSLSLILILFQNCDKVSSKNNISAPFISQKLLLEDSNKHISFPQVTKLNNVLYALYNRGENHYGSCNTNEIMMMKSIDQGQTWTQPVSSFQSPAHSVNVNGLTNNGDHLIATIMERKYQTPCSASTLEYRRYKVIKSIDGINWEYTHTISSFPYGTPLIDNQNNILVSSYWGGEYTAVGKYSPAGNIYNGSGLININTGSAVNAFPFETSLAPFSYSETSYVQIDQNTIYAVSRAFKDYYQLQGPREDYYLFESFSFNNGATWTTPKYLFRGGPADLLKLKDESILRCYTYRKVFHKFGWTRLLFEKEATSLDGGVYCQISEDGAVSWSKAKLIIKNNFHWDFGYSEAVELKDGAILILAYDNDGFATSESSALESSSTGERTYGVQQVILNKAFLKM